MSRFQLIVMFLFCGCLVASCGNQPSEPVPLSPKDQAFATQVPLPNMNSGLQLKISIFQQGEPRTDTGVELDVENLSGKQVSFTYDLGEQVFVYSELDNSWKEVKDLVQFLPQSDLILDPGKQGHTWSTSFTVVPEILDKTKLTEIRVIVIGNVYGGKKKTDEQVGAYIDVVLQPAPTTTEVP